MKQIAFRYGFWMFLGLTGFFLLMHSLQWSENIYLLYHGANPGRYARSSCLTVSDPSFGARLSCIGDVAPKEAALSPTKSQSMLTNSKLA